MLDYYNTHFHAGGAQGVPDFDDSILRRLTAGKDYILSPAIKRAVNLAIFLGQPLLLTGEPGTGKTELARHLAWRFLGDNYRDQYFVFNTKTTSSANDLLYSYDSLKHFQYIQNNTEELSSKVIEERFIQYQALGAAIKSGKRAIVLIDEIDKAPRDLPNDILDVLQRLSFEVPELGLVGNDRIETKSEHRPIVILTSNSEKNLPDAFLRRCVFYHIPFPEGEMLLEILQRKCDRFNQAQLDVLIRHFDQIREQCKRKKPSTAELLQWVAVLEKLDETGQLSPDQIDNPNEEQKAVLQSTYSILVKDKEDLKGVAL